MGVYRGIQGRFPKLGVLFEGSYNKDYSMLGSILGSPCFGKLPYTAGQTFQGVVVEWDRLARQKAEPWARATESSDLRHDCGAGHTT